MEISRMQVKTQEVLLGGVSVSIPFTVPLSALTGNTRMRTVMKLVSGNPTCGDIGDGEAEDYTVQITCPVTTGLSASNISTTGASRKLGRGGQQNINCNTKL
jgi:hypothetical protein